MEDDSKVEIHVDRRPVGLEGSMGVVLGCSVAILDAIDVTRKVLDLML